MAGIHEIRVRMAEKQYNLKELEARLGINRVSLAERSREEMLSAV